MDSRLRSHTSGQCSPSTATVLPRRLLTSDGLWIDVRDACLHDWHSYGTRGGILWVPFTLAWVSRSPTVTVAAAVGSASNYDRMDTDRDVRLQFNAESAGGATGSMNQRFWFSRSPSVHDDGRRFSSSS